jgi:hypothetical protein
MDEDRRRQVMEVRRRIADALIRAAADAELRDRLLADPGLLFSPRDQPRPEVSPQVDEIRRQIITHLTGRVSSDPEFAQQLREDLFQAVRTAGLMPQMEQLRAELPPVAEVTGYGWGGWGWPIWGGWI